MLRQQRTASPVVDTGADEPAVEPAVEPDPAQRVHQLGVVGGHLDQVLEA